jgi:hypothetical protein
LKSAKFRCSEVIGDEPVALRLVKSIEICRSGVQLQLQNHLHPQFSLGLHGYKLPEIIAPLILAPLCLPQHILPIGSRLPLPAQERQELHAAMLNSGCTLNLSSSN